jgi:formate hydrogenlyase subunit 4
MVLDHSGPDLALILYAGSLKFALFASLVMGVLLPRASLSPALALALLLAGLVAIAIAVGIVESVVARLRMNRLPHLLVAASALAAFALILRLS